MTSRPAPDEARAQTLAQGTWARLLLAGAGGLGAVLVGATAWATHHPVGAVTVFAATGAASLGAMALLFRAHRLARADRLALVSALQALREREREGRATMQAAARDAVLTATALAGDARVIAGRNETQAEELRMLHDTVSALRTGLDERAAPMHLARELALETVMIAEHGRTRARDLTERLAAAAAAPDTVAESTDAWARHVGALAIELAVEAARLGGSGHAVAALAARLREQALRGQELGTGMRDRLGGDLRACQGLAEDVQAALQDLGRAAPELQQHLQALQTDQDRARRHLADTEVSLLRLDEACRDTGALGETSSALAHRLQAHSRVWQERADAEG